MKLIGTRTHGTMDYLMGILLIFSPWIFDFVRYDATMWIPVMIGGFILVYSFFTEYERGFIPDITVKTNLCLDGLAYLFLIASPWLFGFSNIVYLPHVTLGLLGLIAAVLTDTVPKAAPRRTHNSII